MSALIIKELKRIIQKRIIKPIFKEKMESHKRPQASNQSTENSLASEKPLTSDFQDALDRNAKNSVGRLAGPIFKNADLADFPPQLAQKAMSAINAGRGLFITGLPGRGKTHLSAAVLRIVLRDIFSKVGRWKSVLWKHESDLLMEIRETFSPGSGKSEGEIIDEFFRADVLFIDDLGVAKVSEWTQQTIDTIIDRRYRSEKITIVTSNLSLSAIEDRLGGRIASRLAAMCEVIHLVGPDRRLMRRNNL